ncbi:heavy metal translocating P-type ATPase [Mycobacterium sp. 852014-52144_SCH5372336]|uniref:heavy metal translocating P-type ATPase n=1 Tax=Mycobacterium sp. 852014-52144_SCH5372336 TaxID=1834115 RepID=UPI000800C44F|nr:heavy metal translocating P-type ATPase [Mycobacterium sp. 852014-52144_SCH5372336]OBB77667.1 metal-transporting ATPase [Mycobacterium sp. 852014-52144_SCH5372336]
MTSAVLQDETAAPAQREALRPRWLRAFALPEVRWASAATVLFLAGLGAQVAGAPAWSWWTLYLACYVTGGWEPGWAGIQALRHKTLDVDLLMIVAAIGAAAIGQVFDGALLIVIFATSGALEAVATQRTEDSVKALLDLAPQQATRIGPDGTEQRVDTAELAVGEQILIRPGERIGADGEILDGASDVDQASITGEPLPVAKTVGDEVFAGTVNGTGMLRVRVDRDASQTVVTRIVAMVSEASATKAKTQLFIEKVEQRYSVGVVVATLALFFVPLAFGAALQPTLLRAMTFMIVASPCAVVLATMPPLLSAIANAGRHGVLVKSAVVMEQLGDTTMVAFDKTGTLTEGTPRLTDIRVLDAAAITETALLWLAASAERPSEHPLGRAVVAAAHERGLRLAHAEDFDSIPGHGIHAVIDGQRVAVSSPGHRLAHTATSASPDQHAIEQATTIVEEIETTGHTAVLVTVDDRPAGVLGLADRLRPNATATTAELTTLTGRAPVLLTGDNPCAAAHLAEQVGITDVRAGLLPADKVSAVRRLESDGERVLLVGDGVNDAPALAAAHTGVAMGRAGSDLALDTADAVVVRDELATIPAVIALSRRARRVVAANLTIAATFITVLVLWDIFGHLPLPLGVAGHEGSTIIVGLNGLRLLREKAWRTAALPKRSNNGSGRPTDNHHHGPDPSRRHG